MAHWTEKYVGRPWSPEYDCAALAIEVLREEYGQNIILPQKMDWRDMTTPEAMAFAKTIAKLTFLPQDGDGILMRIRGNRRTLGSHIGILVEDTWCLHNMERIGVVYQPLSALARGNLQMVGFYRWTTRTP